MASIIFPQEHPIDSKTADATSRPTLGKRIIRELFFVFLALIAFYWASGYLHPLFLDTSLPSEWGQQGWPLATSVTY